MARINYGKTVVDGELRYVSPSSMQVADPASEGCPRKFWYQAIRGIRAPQTKAQMRGTSLHEELERYMKTGDRSLSSLALGGLHMVPDPGPGLGIELPLAPNEDLATAPLRAAGIPVVGFIDLLHARGTNKGAHTIDDTVDPPMTVEVCDWKTTSDPKWIKNAKEMARTIQMNTYGKWVLTVAPKTEHVRLSHGYFVERGGASRKVSLRVLPEHIERNWEHCEATARIMSDVAREADPDRVPANTSVCDRFGGCPARDVCKARMHLALASFVGQTAADKLLGKPGAEPPGEFAMGLLDKVKTGGAGPVVTSTPNETSIGLSFDMLSNPTPSAGPSAEEIAAAEAAKAAERAKLEAEEKAKREAAMLRQAADKFAPLVSKLEAYAGANAAIELGVPAFGGDAAKIYFAVKGAPNGAAELVPGAGKLAGQTVTSQADLEKVVAFLDQAAGEGKIKPAVTATPALAGFPGGLLSNETPAPVVTTPPPTTPAPVAPTPPQASQTPAADVSSPAGGSTPPPANDKPKAEKPKREPKPKTPSGTSFNLIVDAAIEGIAVESFHPMLDTLAHELAQLHSVADVRFPGDNNHPFAFNKWEGAVSACLIEREYPAGWYYLNTRGNRIAEVAAAALREKCQKTGGVFVWGGR